MKKIMWNNYLENQIPEIDVKRHKFVASFNQLINAYEQNVPSITLWEMLNETMGFSMLSFKAEEKFMRDDHHPDYSNHFSKHTAFIQDQLALLQRFKINDNMDMEIPLNNMNNWILNHFKTYDIYIKRPLAEMQ